MKKLLAIFLTVVMLSSVVPLGMITASAATSGWAGDNCRWELNGTTLTISGSGYIEGWAFEYNNSFTDVIIEDGITVIGYGAFYDCTSLASITIPDSVTSISGYAFYSCTSLASINIPENVTIIDRYAFSGCKSLSAVYITNLEAWLNINFINEYSNPLYNGADLYLNDTIVTEITIPNTVTTVDYKFSGCTSLTSITIPDSVTSIGDSAFSNCSSLTSITIPDSVTKIGNEAFSGCKSLANITLSKNIKKINSHTFYNCTSLTSVTIPDKVTSIGGYAFYSCTSLSAVYITDLAAWCNIDFDYRYSNPLYNGADLYLNNALVTEITLPNTTTSIKDCMFAGCKSLTSITIPDSVTSIGYSAFSNCSSLENITIPDSVTSIGDSAFSNCSSLKNIIIPNSVTYIGSYAFEDCKNLTNATLHGDITYIRGGLFRDCIKLNNVTIPNSVKTIGWSAFYNCKSLENITIPDSVTSIGDSAFSNCSSLKNIIIPNSVTYIGYNAFAYCEKLTDVTLSENIERISGYAFNNCYNLSNITIPESVTSIGYGAFIGCYNLSKVNITNLEAWLKVEFNYELANPLCMGADLYLNDTVVTNLTIPSTINTINDYAFYGCGSIKTVHIPSTIKEIGEFAFANSANLNEVTLDEGVSTIYNYAFAYNNKLQRITIPDSVTIIGYGVFEDSEKVCVYCNTNSEAAIQGFDRVVHLDGSDEENIFGGKVGKFDWQLDKRTGLLEITGAGKLIDFKNLSAPWYELSDYIYSIELPTGITSIGANAFENCRIKNISIPENVTSIGDNAFYNCDSLTSIKVPNKVVSIGDHAFSNCKSAETITVPDTVTSMGNGVFFGCVALKEFTLPKNITSIKDFAFYNCNSLTNIDIPNGVTSIGYEAFWNCNNLTNVTIPSTVTSINEWAFEGCENIASVNITDIGAWCNIDFYDSYSNPLCYGADLYINKTLATDIVIPQGVEHVKKYAFYNFQKLENITFGKDVVSIGYDAFYNNAGLNKLTLPSNIKVVEVNAFASCKNLKEVKIYNKNCALDYYCGLNYNQTIHSYKDSPVYDFAEIIGAQFVDISTTEPHTHSFADATCTQPKTCKICGETEGTALAHSYDNDCDNTCNGCDEIREIQHDYQWVIDDGGNCDVGGKKHEECAICHAKRNENTLIPATGNHSYDNNCDETCNVCGAKRELEGHKFYAVYLGDNGSHWLECASCGIKESLETHSYDTACDVSCNICGRIRLIQHNYQWIVDSKENCGVAGEKHEECTICHAKKNTGTKISATGKHSFSGNCDEFCNVCNAKREITHKYTTVTTKATTTKNGSIVKKCNECGKVYSTTVIKYVNSFKLSSTSYTYNGKVKTPTVTVKDSAGKVLKNNTDYKVTYASGRKNVGTYKVTIKMMGNYSGTKELSYKIIPVSTTVSKLTAAKKKLSVVINKKSTQVTGYQIQYSTSKKFNSAKTKNISSYKTTKVTLSGLSAKKTYYVRVRTYKKVGSTVYYSGWSTAKSKKTK